MEKQINTRSLAVDILLAVERDGTFLDQSYREALDGCPGLTRRDRAFIKRLSEGTVERMIELDYILNQFSDTKVKKMKPVIRAILRSGVYQLNYMDAVPDSAVVNEAVRLASSRGFSGLTGFVNGVLRNIARYPDRITYPAREENPARFLSVKYSMPEWITEIFLSEYGQERCERILAAYLGQRPLCVRVDPRVRSLEEVKDSLTAQGVRVTVDPRLPCALHLENCDNPEEIPEFKEGILYVQDVASMLAVETAGPKRDNIILDVCAAPGGKSIHAAQLMEGSGMVIARDRTRPKVDKILENISRCGVSNVHAQIWDACVPDPEYYGMADIVLADTPCSGLGVIGHKPDIKYRINPDDIDELVKLQRQILTASSRYVNPGGAMLFSTCTMTEQENRQNTRWFLEQFPEFTLETEHQYLPDEGCDGFYIAKLVRRPAALA